jgi:hypothetical protein
MGATPQYRVKGTHIQQTKLWIDDRLGSGTFAKIVDTFSEPHRSWPGPILAGSWYDAEPLQDLLRAVAHRLGASVETIATEIAVQNAKRDLVSVYRAFLRVAGPHLTLAATPKLWANYVAFAGARAVTNVPGHYIGEGFDIPKDFVPWACGCWMGFIPTAIEISGGKKVVGKITNRRRQDDGDLWTLQLTVKYE